MLRKWLIVLFWTGVDLGIFALAIASVVYPLLIAAGPKPAAQIATTLLNHALPLSGIKDARARVSDLRIDGAVIEDLRLKDGTTISRIVLSYRPDILTSRNLDHVSVEGVRVSLEQTGVQTGVQTGASSDGGGAEDGWSGPRPSSGSSPCSMPAGGFHDHSSIGRLGRRCAPRLPVKRSLWPVA